ncbi:signal peptide peptidase SppA [Brevibacillus centrosporus]|uniref:signal peptide peptidase SppA n=1 Tax=Brevibacillus centrosporus TaxID=54910 RepID=UPI000F0A96E6|nr:signal peptide peptidase SppA [Brevibacillus centrosporus]MEC2131736.1 signal peptide peptidase SppA [Brevibacillus centrosporus]RNB67383.1 signal peptide peptidase SppA [Brevibacillus centrosporus]GED34390.1 putative signal peptide peptidase SppA [Brevibacillus centrosporus]
MQRKKWVALLIVLVVFAAGLCVEFVSGAYDELAESPGFSWDENIVSGSGTDKIVQLFVTGVISGEQNATGMPSMSELLSEQLRRVEEDENVKALVLRIDSPGGEVVSTDELHTRILHLKQLRHIPVVVSMGSTAASGGYYLATTGDSIFANPNTLTGSLGVIFNLFNYSDAAKKLGVHQFAIKSGRFKDIGSPSRPLTDPERQIFQTLVNESYNKFVFVDVIVKGRNLSRQRVLEIADGRVYSGEQAKRLGLIDQFGDLEEATRYALSLSGSPEAMVVRYTDQLSISKLLLSMKQYWSNPDPLGLTRVLERNGSPKLLYQFMP